MIFQQHQQKGASPFAAPALASPSPSMAQPLPTP